VSAVLGSDTDTSKVRKIRIARDSYDEDFDARYSRDTVADII
jgi:hypothetical protein